VIPEVNNRPIPKEFVDSRVTSDTVHWYCEDPVMTSAFNPNKKTLKTLLSNKLREAITSGVYAPGAVLESERDLCETHRVSRITVRAALDALEKEGLIKRYPRRGAVVATTPRRPGTNPQAKTERLTFLYIRWSRSRNASQQLLSFQRACQELDVDMQIYEARETKDALLTCLKNLPRNINGLLFQPFNLPEELNAMAALIQQGTAVVCTEVTPLNIPVSTVVPDNFTGGHLATEHLITRWRRPVYHIGGSQDIGSAQRMMGWRDTMCDYGYDDYKNFFFDDPGDPYEQLHRGPDYDPSRYGYVAAEEIFSKHKPIHGGYSIFTVNDYIARAVYHVAEKHGLRVGMNVHIVGLANYPFAALLKPPLSTVDIIGNDGYEAAKMLYRLCTDPPTAPLRQIMPVQLIERESSVGLGVSSRRRAAASA
jgi:DNA-binding LacI/PurR family transcriptional regulator